MNSSSLDDFLTQATCAVLREGQIVGTAWLFTSEGHLLTAGHVLDTESPWAEVQVQFGDEPQQAAKVIHWAFEEEKKMDFAILQVVNRVGKRRPLPVRLARFIEGRCRLYGYGQSLEGLTAGVADVVGSFGSESNRLFRLDSKTLADEGFSGGALFSEELKAVVAIQTEAGRGKLGPTKDTIFGLPLYRIAEHWPPLHELIGIRIESGRDPYVGLQTFGEEDADVFYGREQLVQKLVQKVAHSPFLAVLGPSGSGKSSVVRAGLVPALKKGALSHSSQWQCLTIKPTERPLDTLAAALNKLQGGKLGQLAELRRVLGENERALLLAADMARAGNTETRLVLVVDQFEELWTLAPTEPDARAKFVAEKQKPFIGLLLSAIQEQSNAAAPSLLIILTMRADFLHRAAENRKLANAIAEADVIVSPMQPDELQRAISEPLKIVNGVFESGLVDELITQTSEREGALPLLQYTLAELWQAAEPNLYGTPIMTWDAFRVLGGVEGALAQRADTILQQQYTNEQQQQLRHLLVRLVQPGEGAADTRRRIRLAELVPAGSESENILKLLDPLVKNRLLTTGRDPTTNQQTVEVSHEALIRAWPTLSEWIEEAREDLRFHLQLEEAAKEWQIHNENPDFLWSGLRLANAQEWLERTQPQLNERDQRFLQASRDAEAARIAREEAAQREREQLLEAQAAADRRNVSRLRMFLAVATVLLLIALAAAGIAFNRQQQATSAELAATQEAIARQNAEEQTKGAELAATQEAIARQNAEEQTKRAELAATQEAIARQNAEEQTKRAELAATQEAIARDEEVKARQDAEVQVHIVQAQADAAEALFELPNNPDRALLLALAAIRANVKSPQVVVLRNTVETTLIRQALARHTEVLTSVAFSPTGEQLLTGSGDETARLWNAQTGQQLHTLQGHTDYVTSVAFSPSGEQVLTGSVDNTARLWNAQTGQQLHILQGHTDSIISVAFSPSGKQVLTGSADNTARLWDIQTGQQLHTLQRHTDYVTSVVFSPSGKQVLTGSADNTARLWDTQTGTEVHTLQGHTDYVTSVAFSPTAEQVLTGSGDDTARLWDALTGQQIHILQGHTDSVVSVTFSPTAEQVLTGSGDDTARLWDALTGQQIHILQGHTGDVWSVTFSPTGEQLLTGSLDNTASLWDAQTGQQIHTLQGHTDSVVSVAFSPTGEQVLTGSQDNTARLWSADDNLLIAKLTSLVCGVWGHDEEAIRAEIPDWRGCEAELEAVAEDLARYNELRGE